METTQYYIKTPNGEICVSLEDQMRVVEAATRLVVVTDIAKQRTVACEFRHCAECSAGYGARAGESKPRRLCRGCGAVYYCNSECQRRAWKRGHKHQCEKMRRVIIEEVVRARAAGIECESFVGEGLP